MTDKSNFVSNFAIFNFKTVSNNQNLKLMQKGFAVWFTGLSGSGKSTLASSLQQKLISDGLLSILLDGDDLRKGINIDLGFTNEDRHENIRRASEIAKICIQNHQIAICSFITPSDEIRNLAKSIVGERNYIEVYLDCSIVTCEKRDIKNLYKKARMGEIQNFTGITSKFEIPNNPNITIDTESNTIEYCVNMLYEYIIKYI